MSVVNVVREKSLNWPVLCALLQEIAGSAVVFLTLSILASSEASLVSNPATKDTPCSCTRSVGAAMLSLGEEEGGYTCTF